jgi:hypothetical protein
MQKQNNKQLIIGINLTPEKQWLKGEVMFIVLKEKLVKEIYDYLFYTECDHCGCSISNEELFEKLKKQMKDYNKGK